MSKETQSQMIAILKEAMTGGVPTHAKTAEDIAAELDITKMECAYLLTKLVNKGKMNRGMRHGSRIFCYWEAS